MHREKEQRSTTAGSIELTGFCPQLYVSGEGNWDIKKANYGE